MYIIVVLADVVQIKPESFDLPSHRAIENWINEKYADKVLPKIGLCVGFHSLIKTSEGLIGHGDGLVNINVDFRLLVFRPFQGEIITASITDCDKKEGIFLRTEFFEDIIVPPSTLPEGTTFDDEQGVFVWKYVDEADPENAMEYYFDNNETCLIRVEEELWTDMTRQRDSTGRLVELSENDQKNELIKRPYVIRASMQQSGTGPKIWWLDPGDEGYEDVADRMDTDG